MNENEIIHKLNKFGEALIFTINKNSPDGELSRDQIRAMIEDLRPTLLKAEIISPPPFRSPIQPPVKDESPIAEEQKVICKLMLERVIADMQKSSLEKSIKYLQEAAGCHPEKSDRR